MPSTPRKSTVIHEGRVFKLIQENIRLPNGVETTLDIIRHPGAAAIVPVTAQGRVMLIRQFRHAAAGHIWEIPAGTMEPGESPLACAQRELGEEVGVSAGRWFQLGEVLPLPAYSDEVIHLYRAEELRPARQQLDPDEILEVHEFSYDDAMEMIKTGAIRDAKTITGLKLARSMERPAPD